MKKYITNFSRGCFHHWTAPKAVMELVQNWLDSDGKRSYEFSGDTLLLINEDIRVSNRLLMMGQSDKRDDDSKRGQFGVGSIQAMVVLTDLGIHVVIDNNDVQWCPRFEHNDDFDTDIMAIHEYPMYSPNSNFTVEINGLSYEDINEIKQRCLEFQDREVLYSTKYGDIIKNLDGETGEVFCGELYVCQNSQFKYSYNFKPKVIELSQDRDAVSQWDMQTLTAKMIIETGDNEFIKKAIQLGDIDTDHVRYDWAFAKPSSDINNDLASSFLETRGVSLITSDYDEHEQNVKLGNKSVYNPNKVMVKSIKQSELYQKAISEVEFTERKSFVVLMEELLETLDYIVESHDDLYTILNGVLDEVKERVSNEDWS